MCVAVQMKRKITADIPVKGMTRKHKQMGLSVTNVTLEMLAAVYTSFSSYGNNLVPKKFVNVTNI